MLGYLRRRAVAALLAGAALTLPVLARPAEAETRLRVFVGGQERPDVMRPLLDRYQREHPGVTVELEVGGATSEMQQQYLTTTLASKDSAIDVMLIDVVRPAQFAAAGWAEPLKGEDLLDGYLPVYKDASQAGGEVLALPGFADAMFLYYRKDLLEKHGLQPPATWDELTTQAKAILAAEQDPNLEGLSFQAKSIEGAVCTFLVPYWSAGGTLAASGAEAALNRDAATRSLDLWQGMVSEGVARESIAEVGTDDTRREFEAGQAVFAVLWAYGWNRFQEDPDSQVKGKVGVAPLPAVKGGRPATCIGGWQWAVSAFSRNKEAATALVRFLAGPVGAKHLALHASNLPALSALYDDPDVLRANPWFKDAKAAVESAHARPESPRYPEVSDAIRSNLNAAVAGVKTTSEAVAEMEARLSRLLR